MLEKELPLVYQHGGSNALYLAACSSWRSGTNSQWTCVRDNIRYGCLDADKAAVERAAQRAGIAEMHLPEGLETAIGTRGNRLSGGQRQRVAIARALVREAPMIVLDEATSSLDALAEERLRVTLDELRQRHTVLLVAHRLSTVHTADIIAVVDDGRVVETGSHAELLARNGA